MEIVEDFIQKFHALEGTTVANRRKNFYILLHQSAPTFRSNVEILNAVSENLKPRTYLEQLFQVDFFVYFRRKQELVNLLKEGNDVFVSKVIKQVWFFQDAFSQIEAEELVNEILPSMSFSVRMKVLRKLCQYLNSDKFECIFDAVAKRYGIFIASQFITGCGSQKIKQILDVYPIQLTSKQLEILHGKDQQLIDFYFTTTKNSIHSFHYKDLLRFIYRSDPSLFAHLKEKYKISVTLGRRATKKFVVFNKDNIIQKPADFCNLNMKAVIRKLGKESVQLFINSLPQNLEPLNTSNNVICSFSDKYLYKLYVTTFQAHYNIKFEDYPTLIDQDLLNLIKDHSERSALAKVKLNEGCDEFITYLSVDESIPLIKEKINLTSDIDERGDLIQLLIETCFINDDLSALLSVMQYFYTRHKNDDISVHLKFIENIENLFGFKQFSEEMWNSLNDLLTIHMLKFDRSAETYKKIQTFPLVSLNVGTSVCQKISYLEFLFKAGKSVDELLKDYFTTNSTFPRCDEYDKNFVKYFLLFAINNIAQENTEKKHLQFNCCLIAEVSWWNHSNKDSELSFYDFPVLFNTFNYCIRNFPLSPKSRARSTDVVKIFRHKIFTTIDNKYRKEYLQIYWENFDYYGNLADIKWFLKYDPITLAENFDQFFYKISREQGRDMPVRLQLWYSIKKFSHLQLDERAIQLSLDKLSNDLPENKGKFVPCLSVVMKPGDYAALTESYKPSNKKLNLKMVADLKVYYLASVLAKNFKNTKSYEVLPSLMNYCVGDYLKDAITSLYALLYRTPENILSQHLNYLSKQAVSVRKHALFLTCELSTCTKVEHILKLLNKQEGTKSLQSRLFLTSIQYFVKNPSDNFFENVKLNMTFIGKTDAKALKNIVKHFAKIPKRYRTQYFEYSWEFLEKTVDIWKKLAPLKQSLLSGLTAEEISLIRLELVFRIIDQHFMTGTSLDNINVFIYDLLFYREEKNILFEKIFAILDKQQEQVEVYKFLCTWFYKIMGTKNNSLEYMEPYVTYFEKKISILENFYDYIKMFFLKEKLHARNLSLEIFLTRVVSFCREVTSKCGLHITSLLAKEVNSNLRFFTNEKSGIRIHYLYQNMLKNNRDPFVAILILFAMPEPPSVKTDDVEIFYNILQEIKKIDDVGVQINLYSKFSNVLKSEKFLKYVPTDMEIDDK